MWVVKWWTFKLPSLYFWWRFLGCILVYIFFTYRLGWLFKTFLLKFKFFFVNVTCIRACWCIFYCLFLFFRYSLLFFSCCLHFAVVLVMHRWFFFYFVNLIPYVWIPFWIAGVYGDVQRVKILYEKRDNALIQMSDANQAQLGKHGDFCQNSFLGHSMKLTTKSIALYTGWPKKPEQSISQDFALINSYLFSPCWIEHLFLIIIKPRSPNLVENFLFYE